MQNKINQKVPIAKMDELIAAVKESGGGGSKLYQHRVTMTFTVSSKSGTAQLIIYNRLPDEISSLTPNYISNSLSIMYPRVYIYNSFFDIIYIGSSFAIGFQENSDYSVTNSQLTYAIDRDVVSEF